MTATVPEDLVIVRGGPERIPDLEPLWLALRDHHHSVTADWGPVHDDTTSWDRRRRAYERWLREPDAFVLVAEQDGRAVGYALVRVSGPSPTWAGLERSGEIETLSVLPGARGRGIGAALLEAVDAELDRIGVAETVLTVVEPNVGARRFYERLGFETLFLTMRRRRRTR
jgi:ribosomal protein S18 acetylase RimI-like enzyme